MRRLAESTKAKRGYGTCIDGCWNPYIHAGEFGSLGTCSNPVDWITGRTVHLFSQGEAQVWHILRWADDVVDVQEQYPLILEDTLRLAAKYEIPHPNRGKTKMTSDFLVKLTDGEFKVISVKTSRRELDDRTAEKLFLEKQYWREKGVPFELVFSKEINTIFAENIRTVVAFYDSKYVVGSDDIAVLKHLIAHKKVCVEMKAARLDYPALLKIHGEEVRKWRSTLR